MTVESSNAAASTASSAPSAPAASASPSASSPASAPSAPAASASPSAAPAASTVPAPQMLNIALPKGRLGEEAYAALAAAGYQCEGVLDDSRKLVFSSANAGVTYFWVKPSDVAVYVERGAADLGIVGKDSLIEQAPSVYELIDLEIGKCYMAVAAPTTFADDGRSPLRVATKYGNVARNYYASLGRDIDIIPLNGSIELAPVIGLSDVIVDIVQTGKTLQENGLEPKAKVFDISARLIANKASYEFKRERIMQLTQELKRNLSASANA